MNKNLKKKLTLLIGGGNIGMSNEKGRTVYSALNLKRNKLITIDCEWYARRFSVFIGDKRVFFTTAQKNEPINQIPGYTEFMELVQACNKKRTYQMSRINATQHVR